MHQHMDMLAFYYNFIRNFDAAELEGEAKNVLNEEL